MEARTLRGGPEHLTTAELRMLRHLASYRTVRQIAGELYIAHSTAKTHALAIYRKLHVNNRADAVRRGIELGLVSADEWDPDARRGRR